MEHSNSQVKRLIKSHDSKNMEHLSNIDSFAIRHGLITKTDEDYK
jgi:hypothetical protein